MRTLWLLTAFLSGSALASQTEESESHHQASGPADCSDMEVWDYDMSMCMPFPMKDMPMRMLMIHGNAFAVGSAGQGPRGRTKLSGPNMFMADLGTSLGDRQYLNLDLMTTFEKWTFPKRGYPLPLQIGEEDDQHRPFLDAQHPHSSPIMGLTISNTIRLNDTNKNYLKLFFAPRGQTTDGPIAFMHRPTGILNPDAPLGHHIGQDVGHISSTVIGASLRWSDTTLQGSAFNGTEPKPTHVDLPLGTPSSFAFRLIQEFPPIVTAMASVARVKDPEPDEPGVEWRYSASVYEHLNFEDGWALENALIYGAITHLGGVSALHSIGEEFALVGDHPRVFGRLELLQRTGAQLQIPGLEDSNQPRWVTAVTLGYSHVLVRQWGSELALGASVTKDFLPSDFRGAYDGNPWSGKVFLQVSGMGMWDL